jgi:hypothetical protein
MKFFILNFINCLIEDIKFLFQIEITDAKQRLDAVRHLVCLLPVPNRDTLEMLLKLLDKVREHAATNRMDAFNLAMVFGPNLLKKHKPSTHMPTSLKSMNDQHSAEKYSLIDDIDSVIQVTRYLIENNSSIFSVSLFSRNFPDIFKHSKYV